jgi:hypothetical protein
MTKNKTGQNYNNLFRGAITMEFYKCSNTTNTNVPEWMRSFGIHPEKGIFVPAIYSGQNETETMLCASFDGISICSHRGHIFVPLAWMEEEYPKEVELFQRIREKVEQLGINTSRFIQENHGQALMT